MFPGAFPVDLVIKILLLLPAESFARLYYVSKEWRSFITTPYFISLHLNKPTNDQTTKFLLRHYDEQDQQEHFSLLDVAENKPFTINSSTLVNFRYGLQHGFFYIAGSCRGVVCLADTRMADPEQPIFLWNPSIRKHLRLPPATMGSFEPHFFALGFGYSANDDDFKVVRFVAFREVPNCAGFYFPPVAEVFSIKIGSWRPVDVDLALRNVRVIWSPAFLNGVVHWLAHSTHRQVCRNSILMFWLNEEEFEEMPLPSQLAMRSCISLSLVLMGESLAVIDYHTRVNGAFFDVWLMERYGDQSSWRKSYSCSGNGRVVALRENGEALMTSEGIGLVAKDLENSSTTIFGISGMADGFFADGYSESLELLTTGQDDWPFGLHNGEE